MIPLAALPARGRPQGRPTAHGGGIARRRVMPNHACTVCMIACTWVDRYLSIYLASYLGACLLPPPALQGGVAAWAASCACAWRRLPPRPFSVLLGTSPYWGLASSIHPPGRRPSGSALFVCPHTPATLLGVQPSNRFFHWLPLPLGCFAPSHRLCAAVPALAPNALFLLQRSRLKLVCCAFSCPPHTDEWCMYRAALRGN